MKSACEKARVVRKSRGQQCPYGFDSRPRHTNPSWKKFWEGFLFFVHSLQFHLERHIDNVIVIRSSVILALMIVVCLADILRDQSQIIKQLDIESGIPSRLLEPCETVLWEVAPVWFKGEMHFKRRLRNWIICLCTCTKNCWICARVQGRFSIFGSVMRYY